MGTKWAPRYVRITDDLPVTATTKVLKRVLRAEAWRCTEPVWWRPQKDEPYRVLGADDAAMLDQAVSGR
jgi:fatty-acyl-CoA synthase